MSKLNWLEWLVIVLVIVGSINWGLSALGLNLVDAIFGMGSTVASIIYILVGLSGLYMIMLVKKLTKSSMM